MFKPILILAVLLACNGKAQQLQFDYIGDKLGLPAHECYNVMQDSKGYIWISTEAGLCKYNGTTSKVFDKKNGLPENSCYSVKEDKNGKLWMLTSTNRVLNYLNDTLQEVGFSKSYVKALEGNLNQSYVLAFKNDSLVLSSHKLTYLATEKSNEVHRFLPDTNCGFYFIKTNIGLFNVKSAVNQNLTTKLLSKNIILLGINTGKEIKLINVPYKDKGNPSWRVLICTNKKGEGFIAIGNILVKLNADLSHTVYDLPTEALCLYSDTKDGLWVGNLKGGVYHYSDTRFMESKTENLTEFSVSGVCVDAENGVWCTTLEKGVFYCRNKSIINYSNNSGINKQADLLKNEGGKIFMSLNKNELIEINKQKLTRYQLNLMGNYEIDDILTENENCIIAGKNFIVRTNNKYSEYKYVNLNTQYTYAGANQLEITPDNRLFAVHFGRLIEIFGEKGIDRKNPLESAGSCILQSGKYLFYGCKDGLYKMLLDQEANGKPYVSKKVNGINGNVVKIIESSKKEIWIATKENGLFLLKGNELINMNEVLGLPTERCFDIIQDRFGTIWVATYVGLIKIDGNKFSIVTKLNGLLADEVLKVAADSFYVYVSTTEGINRLPITEEIRNLIEPKIYLSSVKVNGAEISDAKKTLTHDENSLKIELDILTFKDINSPSFYYELRSSAINLKTGTVKGNILYLENLGPDNYELKIFAVSSDGVKSVTPVDLRFEIGKPFWSKMWFIVVFALGLGLLVYFVVKQIIKRVRKSEEEKTEINRKLAEFQLTALQAQMNPHFIFNAINSIQDFILKKKEKEAYNYLAKFSKLIRIVLNNSEQKTLSLNEELEAIKLYVELEQLRFKDNFEFNLTIAENVDEHSTQVPTMLIQPYIENAIWHGLMNLDERKGALNLTIEIENALLKITVQDNGIGRAKTAEYKKGSVHKPVAMKVTEKRFLMINTMQDYAGAKVSVSDLADERGSACGTKIEMYLPIV